MGLHHDILPYLVEICVSIHDECGVVLIGSVARGTERMNSDIDLNIIFPRDECPLHRSPYVDDDNCWQLKLKDHVQEIRIDVAWETQTALLERLYGEDVVNCWPFSNGQVLHDPYEIAAPCLTIAQNWFASHADVASRYEAAYAAAKNKWLREHGNL
jgi:hypothetical protein